jgi:hypothetical protein
MADAPCIPRKVRECGVADREQFEREIAAACEPIVFRRLIADWPAVEAGRQSAEAIRSYLTALDRGAHVGVFVGPPEMEGRFFYEPQLRGFNFGVSDIALPELLAILAAGTSGQHIYMGSTPAAEFLSRFADENQLGILRDKKTEPRLWIGNDSIIAPHFDESDNLACVVSGRRRFTLFAPDQIANLYVGPIDTTVAGQPASMVELASPDFERFPRFRDALEHAVVADLEPGDAIHIPALWWHGVQASGPLNVLVNYWWQDSPPDAGSPMNALGAALLSIALLPEHKRLAWRSFFDHFVFKLNGDPAAHIPEHARGILGRSTPELRRMMREFLVRELRGK